MAWETIPRGLSEDEAKVYEGLIDIAKERKQKGLPPRPMVVITDIGKDYDDLATLVILKEFHRLQLVELRAVVVNLMPENTRTLFARVVMESLGLGNIPVACGTRGSPIEHEELDYEFKSCEAYGSDALVSPGTMENLRQALKQAYKFPKDSQAEFASEFSEKTFCSDGQAVLLNVYESAEKKGEKLFLLLISSLQDIEEFSSTYPDLVANNTAEVHMQGGNYISEEGNLEPDSKAANNKFNMDAAAKWHSFIQSKAIPSWTYTKVAAYAAELTSEVFVKLEATGHPVGANLRRVQVEQDLAFYKQACESDPKKRFQPFMDQKWFLANKTNWRHFEEEEEAPPIGKAIIPFHTKIILYDVHAAFGAAGDDVVVALNVFVLMDREIAKCNHRISFPDQGPLAPEGLLAMSALMRGSLLAVKQGLPSEPKVRWLQ